MTKLKDSYTTKYPYNPNQKDKNPEFFSKKIGNKLLKVLNMDEFMNSEDIIKISLLSCEQHNDLMEEYQMRNNQKGYSSIYQEINDNISEMTKCYDNLS